MVPLNHTTLSRTLEESAPSTALLAGRDTNRLINLDQDSEDSSEDTSLSGDPSTCWVPKGGDISILQRDLANAISEGTKCIFCPEPEYHRVRIVGGNTQVALSKLQRIEPLFVSLKC